MYFLKTASSLSDCGHINRLRVVKVSNFYLQLFLQIVYLNEAQFNIASIGIYAPYRLPLKARKCTGFARDRAPVAAACERGNESSGCMECFVYPCFAKGLYMIDRVYESRL
jgi:hypothetical protein